MLKMSLSLKTGIRSLHSAFCNFLESMMVSAGSSQFIVVFKVLQDSWIIAVDSLFRKPHRKKSGVHSSQSLCQTMWSWKSCEKAAILPCGQACPLAETISLIHSFQRSNELSQDIRTIFHRLSKEQWSCDTVCTKHQSLMNVDDFYAVHVEFLALHFCCFGHNCPLRQ